MYDCILVAYLLDMDHSVQLLDIMISLSEVPKKAFGNKNGVSW